MNLSLHPILPLLAALGCHGDGRPAPVAADQARSIALSTLPFAELELPEDCRPDHAAAPTEIPLNGPFRYIGSTRKGMQKYATEIPIRPRGLFFNKPQPGLELHTADGKPVRYDRFAKGTESTWGHDRTELTVYQPDQDGGPKPGQYVLTYPKAVERENGLNLKWSGKDKAQFAWTAIQDDWDNRRGLLVPAPGRAAWDLDVPPAGELHFASGLVEPEVKQGPPSDGATLRIEVEVGGATTEVYREVLALHAFGSHRVDLSKWAGQHVRLRMITDPGATPTYDYAFVAEPFVASRKADPTRVVMIFVDTLRPDHMSLYGYDRDTSAAIDHLANEAAVFSDARSVAPWTLPSSRTIVTGRQPEEYGVATTIQSMLHDQGFATGMFAGNVYLSVNFGMTRDWDFHRVGLWPPASESTDEALRWLADHDGQDVLLQLHFMSNHLPYVEPDPWRHKYTDTDDPKLRDGFLLSDVKHANLGQDAEGQQYVKDRYDNNVAFATDQTQRILDALDDDDIVLFFADHGEELWDHQGFEHGHTLYDELLRVPMVIRAPGIEARRIDSPVSLLDLVPTILDLLGRPIPPELDGSSLVPLMKGESGAAERFAARDQAFGRPLYGSERWGVLHGPDKWTTHEGKETVFDVQVDPAEKTNLAKLGDDEAAYHRYLGAALGRPVGEGYRLQPTNHRGGGQIPGLWALCTVPGGFSEAWKGDDPLDNSQAVVKVVDDRAQIASLLQQYGVTDHPIGPEDGAVEVCWQAGWFGAREIYAMPTRPLSEVGHQMVCSAYHGDRSGGQHGTMQIPSERDATLAGPRTPALAKLSLDSRQLAWSYGVAPVPDPEMMALVGRDAETNEMLEAIGYVDPDKSTDDVEPITVGGCEPPATPSSPPHRPGAP